MWQPGQRGTELASVGDDYKLLLWDTRAGSAPAAALEKAHGENDLHCVDWSSLEPHLLVTGARPCTRIRRRSLRPSIEACRATVDNGTVTYCCVHSASEQSLGSLCSLLSDLCIITVCGLLWLDQNLCTDNVAQLQALPLVCSYLF